MKPMKLELAKKGHRTHVPACGRCFRLSTPYAVYSPTAGLRLLKALQFNTQPLLFLSPNHKKPMGFSGPPIGGLPESKLTSFLPSDAIGTSSC